jgi:hypothetical protein
MIFMDFKGMVLDHAFTFLFASVMRYQYFGRYKTSSNPQNYKHFPHIPFKRVED